MADTMKAVIFHGPYKVAVEDRPVPRIQDDTDIIVKVKYTALCGSELHAFRGHQPAKPPFIMGHEFTGTVVETGGAVKTVKVGDVVVSPFTTSCGDCFYCKRGISSRCVKSLLFGSALLDGGQAEYVRVPWADGTVCQAPEGVEEKLLVLMADIYPTGYFAAHMGFSAFGKEETSELTAVLIGCGPVGLLALVSALEYKPKHLLAVDSVPSRLEQARILGAEPWNFMTDREGLDKRVKELTDGRGADLVIEVVGQSPALRTAFDLLRPAGTISSVGVHNAEIPWTGNEGFHKNLNLHMGRCSVRSIFPESLQSLKRNQHLLGFMADKLMSLEDAVEGYDIFDKMKVQKVIFEPTPSA